MNVDAARRYRRDMRMTLVDAAGLILHPTSEGGAK